jgi:hypothetical protein
MKGYLWDLILYGVFAIIFFWSVAFRFGEVSRFWIFIYCVLAGISVLLPYYLNDLGDDLLTRIYTVVSFLLVSTFSYFIYQEYIDAKKSNLQSICGEVINLTVTEKVTLFDHRHRFTRRYSYEVVSSTQPSVQFNASSGTIDEGQNWLCIDYIDKRKSWLFSEHKVIHIRYQENPNSHKEFETYSRF